ncbi:MAG: methylated-DNA--[protein]-cysteine S-methyltransferase [Syntrophomonadaceae bacterium]|jgi:methylated-DNA-[protein]-cysteine S-methyltransferase
MFSWYIFHTKKGWAAFLGKSNRVRAAVLPVDVPLPDFMHRLKDHNIVLIDNDNHSIALVNKIRGYYEGEIITDWEVEIDLPRSSDYARKVLYYVHTIPYGQTQTYSTVASKTGRPKAARAVGRIMGNNPIPLIIPCHRVIAKNGWGGFSAPGGVYTKKSMILWEQYHLSRPN